MKSLNSLISQNQEARSCFLSLNEQKQGFLIQHADSIQSVSDLMQVLREYEDSNEIK